MDSKREEECSKLLDAMYLAGVAAPDTFAPYSEEQLAGADRALDFAREGWVRVNNESKERS
jgi:hypothetical protein